MLFDVKSFSNIIDKYSILEGKSHLEHPEDLVIINDIAGAKRAIQSTLAAIKNPKTISIKWDGYPALVFGRGSNGKFAVMDKHMFNKKDGSGRQIYSPEQFVAYDKARGVDRAELYNLISNAWEGLQKASQGTKGYYWGDLLFSQPLKAQNGVYKFKANPNGITYTVDADSDIGKLLTDKVAGIAVHQYIPPDAVNTDSATNLDGTLGNLKNNSNVALVPSAMPITPDIKINNQLVKKTESDIAKYGKSIQTLMSTAPQARSGFNTLFTQYINQKVISGDLSNLADDFLSYFESRPMTVSMKKKLADHINNNKQGIIGLFTVWTDLYNLKMNVVNQLSQADANSPVKGYLQSGQQSQEGFVSQGLKFIDRMGFSRQNLAARA